MARAITNRRKLPMGMGVRTEVPGLVVDTQEHWVGAKGLDLFHRLNKIPPQYARECQNMEVDEGGVLRSRRGVQPIGTASTGVMGVVKFITGDGLGRLLRFKTDTVELWSGSAWTTVPGTYTLTGGTSDRFAVTSFGDALIFSNGVNGIFKYSVTTGVIENIKSDISARRLTTFAGRIIASDAKDPEWEHQRIRWPVKYSETDWDGDGSGYEDLESTPGGQIDQQHGVWPVTDTTALVVRSQSTWIMMETGNVLSPFRFSMAYANLGSKSPHSIAAVPGGVVMLGLDDVYAVSPREFKPIGTLVKDEIFNNATSLGSIVGAYDPDRRMYALLVPTSAGNYVYKFSFREQGWSRHLYSTDPDWISFGREAETFLTFDELTGTFDALTGTLDALGAGVDDDLGGLFLSASTVVVREDPTASRDDFGAGDVDGSIIVATGVLQAASPRDKTQLIELWLEYEADETQVLRFEYTDRFGTWQTFGGPKTVTSTVAPQIVRTRQTITNHDTRVRVRSTTLGKLRILGMYTNVVKAGEVQGSG